MYRISRWARGEMQTSSWNARWNNASWESGVFLTKRVYSVVTSIFLWIIPIRLYEYYGYLILFYFVIARFHSPIFRLLVFLPAPTRTAHSIAFRKYQTFPFGILIPTTTTTATTTYHIHAAQSFVYIAYKCYRYNINPGWRTPSILTPSIWYLHICYYCGHTQLSEELRWYHILFY